MSPYKATLMVASLLMMTAAVRADTGAPEAPPSSPWLGVARVGLSTIEHYDGVGAGGVVELEGGRQLTPSFRLSVAVSAASHLVHDAPEWNPYEDAEARIRTTMFSALGFIEYQDGRFRAGLGGGLAHERSAIHYLGEQTDGSFHRVHTRFTRTAGIVAIRATVAFQMGGVPFELGLRVARTNQPETTSTVGWYVPADTARLGTLTLGVRWQ